jgi:hypothetical protein
MNQFKIPSNHILIVNCLALTHKCIIHTYEVKGSDEILVSVLRGNTNNLVRVYLKEVRLLHDPKGFY